MALSVAGLVLACGPLTACSTAEPSTARSPTAYSAKDLVTAGERVLVAARAGKVPDVASVIARPDGTGLVVYVRKSVRAGDVEMYQAVAGVPVTLEKGRAPVPTRP